MPPSEGNKAQRVRSGSTGALLRQARSGDSWPMKTSQGPEHSAKIAQAGFLERVGSDVETDLCQMDALGTVVAAPVSEVTPSKERLQ